MRASERLGVGAERGIKAARADRVGERIALRLPATAPSSTDPTAGGHPDEPVEPGPRHEFRVNVVLGGAPPFPYPRIGRVGPADDLVGKASKRAPQLTIQWVASLKVGPGRVEDPAVAVELVLPRRAVADPNG